VTGESFCLLHAPGSCLHYEPGQSLYEARAVSELLHQRGIKAEVHYLHDGSAYVSAAQEPTICFFASTLGGRLRWWTTAIRESDVLGRHWWHRIESNLDQLGGEPTAEQVAHQVALFLDERPGGAPPS
jgi:hypothetical protein